MKITERASQAILGVRHTAPSFDVPPDACDCHTHVFGPVEIFPFAKDRLYTPGPASIADLSTLHRALRVDRVVVVHPSCYGTNNACTVDALRWFGKRARGVAVIDETFSDAMLADLHDAGVRGVRVNLESYGESSPDIVRQKLVWAAERVAPLGWHVQTYTNISILTALHDTILKLPVALVVDHFGRPKAALGTSQPGLPKFLDLLRSGKVYVKISAPYRISQAPHYPDAAPIAKAMIAANPDRILWGTDWPHPGAARSGMPRNPAVIEPFRAEDDGEALNRLASWTANRTELQRILVDNPARLYQFSREDRTSIKNTEEKPCGEK
ncbi:MAG TPA: amidohydrolase family protein [Pseudolabrys sp.]|nr:amidohydrolase family protein [Pseudolabrys sp.]